MNAYRYELRRGDEVVATGHLNPDRPLQIGETITIGSLSGIVCSIQPQLHDPELQLVVRLARDGDQATAG